MPSIEQVLRESKTIAVVGLSGKPMRASYGVSEYMQRQGYRIIPVNPMESEVLGEKAYASLEDIPEPVDIVDIFRRSEFVPDIVDAAIRIGAKAVWMRRTIHSTSPSSSVMVATWTLDADRSACSPSTSSFATTRAPPASVRYWPSGILTGPPASVPRPSTIRSLRPL